MNRALFVAIISFLSIAVMGGCGTSGVGVSDTAVSSAAQTEVSDVAEITESSAAEEVSSKTEESSAVEEELFTDSVEDLGLSVDKKDICIGKDDNEIIFVVRDIIEPHKVELVDEDTGTVVGEMLDDADFEHSGDDIMGDAWYSLRYRVDDTFPTDPDISEDREYHYYARYIEDSKEHRSNTVKIFVYENFTDSELDVMQTVNDKISEVMDSEEYDELDIEEKKERVLTVLDGLEEQGLIDKGSVYSNDDMISYSVGGISSGIMLKPFDPLTN